MTAKRKLPYNIYNLIKALGVLPIIVLIYVVAYFAAFAVTVMTGGVDVLDADTAIVNEGLFNFLRFTLTLIVLGWIYIKDFYRYEDKSSEKEVDERKISVKKSIKYTFRPSSIVIMLLAGFCIQLGTDGILYILGELFPTTFASYQHMMETFTGSISPLFIITTITIGPIAEELAFRGLILGYFNKVLGNAKRALIVACTIQALLFGLYHINLVQMCYAFIFGMLFGLLSIRFKSLVPSIFLHMIVNGSLYVIPEAFLGNIYHAALVAVISFVLLAAGLIIFITRASDKTSE